MSSDPFEPFVGQQDTVGFYVLVATQHATMLREYLIESRVPFASNPEIGYDRRKVEIEVPTGFDLFSFGRDITYRGVHDHLAHIFDGLDMNKMCSCVNCSL